MKKYVPFLLLFLSYSALAQVGINATGTAPVSSAMLDISSINKGVLIPRMTTIQKNAIQNPIEGLMVYDTDVKQFSYAIAGGTGTLIYWVNFGNTPSNWYGNGNNLTNTNSGNVGIGNYTPAAKLDVAGKIKIGNDTQAGTEGTIRYNSTNKYFEGFDGTNWGAFNANNAATLPQSAIILSETKTNTNLTNAGYSLNGVTEIKNSQYVAGGFGWYKSLSTINPISSRNYHKAVWTGTKMIIWGGIFSDVNGNTFLNDGKAYDPTNDVWLPITTPSFIVGRTGHSAIWTGSKMIVWGGSNSTNGYLNDGAIYDPSADSWTTITTSNTPSIRGNHTSIWTGNKMIIWGGNNNIVYLNDGKIYDLSTGTWSSISTLNAPSPLFYHTSIWTGSKMIIWGGTVGSSLPNGKIFDPITNSWTSINSTNAPQVASGHSAIWTGSKMIIFGGNGFANTTKIYDPQTDTWVTGSSTNAPNLFGHTAIWTGSKMIVFGGNTIIGGIYDPVSDSWDSNQIQLNDYTTNTHSAVWTGEDMLIFYQNKGYMLKKDFTTPTTKAMYLFQKN